VFVSMSSTALIGVPQRDAGVASALVNTMQQVGGSLGVAFLNTIAATTTAHYLINHHAVTSAAQREGLTHGFTTAFTISAIIFAVAGIVVTSLIRARKSDVAAPVGAVDGEAVTEPVLAG
jgi:heme/copper-type cytochrome/quinol oxidase subunit 2